MKRLDRVVAVQSNNYITKGKIYIVLGVKKDRFLIATDLKKKIYLSSQYFISEEEQNRNMIKRLEERGF